MKLCACFTPKGPCNPAIVHSITNYLKCLILSKHEVVSHREVETGHHLIFEQDKDPKPKTKEKIHNAI